MWGFVQPEAEVEPPLEHRARDVERAWYDALAAPLVLGAEIDEQRPRFDRRDCLLPARGAARSARCASASICSAVTAVRSASVRAVELEVGHRVSATQTPLPAVRAATIAIAQPAPSASATTPARSAPTTKPKSRQKR